MAISSLWRAPKIDVSTGKALTIPVLNPIDIYGRCFHLAWLGFFVAFLSWFAFPPLLHSYIGKDLKLTPADVANSNIVGLCATLVARFILGPLCDKFGPRYVMAGTLLVGAIPTALIPCVNNLKGLHAIRFFIGFLGGTFIPCQMWTTTFYDKSIVGRANAFVGGWGNAGGGVAFFVMPAITDDFLRRGYALDKSWKYAFVVGPFIIIMFVAFITVIFGQDCPEGKWSERTVKVASFQGEDVADSAGSSHNEKDVEKRGELTAPAPTLSRRAHHPGHHEAEIHVTDTSEAIENPTFVDVLKVAFHWSTGIVALTYFCSFGGELAIEGALSGFYQSQAKVALHQTWSGSFAGDWASMMGLLNVVTRPTGGYISDILYAKTGRISSKKYLICFFNIVFAFFAMLIGWYKKMSMASLIVCMALMSVFMEAANGANFSLVPAINKHHTGIVAGTTGAVGNLGGILFNLAFRFCVTSTGATDYHKAMWAIGLTILIVNVIVVFVPLPKRITSA